MTTLQLRLPEDLREKIAKRYHHHCRLWLTSEKKWPLIWTLGSPTEADARQYPDNLLAWISAWQSWQGKGELIWSDKYWRSLGKQRLPDKLLLKNASEAADWIGETVRWERAESRYKHFCTKWPALASCLPRYFDMLADYSPVDIERLEKMLEWITAYPQSNLYPRQLPIAGLDTKWLERRTELLNDLIAAIQGDVASSMDVYRRCGLKQPPTTMRIRILDKVLQEQVGGLEDITAPIHAIAALNMPAIRVYIVENLQTGLAFGDLPGSVLIVGLGYHVDMLSALPWLKQAKCFYWGDIDTHGFAILNRVRSHLPDVQSLLMDDKTLHQHQPLWGNEDKQHAAVELPLLTAAEQALYDGLKQQHWGENVRLEQEKIGWDWALKYL